LRDEARRVAADIGCLLFVFASGRRFAKCLRVQTFQQTVDLHIPDEITDVFDLLTASSENSTTPENSSSISISNSS
jgi:hypothetical protein